MLKDSAKHKSDCLFFEWKYVNYTDPLFSVSKYWNAGNPTFIAQCRRAETKDWFNRPVLYPCEECPYYEQTGYAACRFVLFDDANRQILDAKQDDLSVHEGPLGQPLYAKMRILSFSNSEAQALPDASVICIDAGDTMNDYMGNIRGAMHNWVEGMWYHGEVVFGVVDVFNPNLVSFSGSNAPAADLIGVISSDATVTVAHDITSAMFGTTAITNAIDAITVGTGSAIFDAVIEAVGMLAYSGAYGTLSILLISNGNDDSSTHTRQEAIAAAVAADIRIHTLAISGNQHDPTVMTDLSSGTGGTYALCSSLDDIQAAAEIIRGTERGGGYQMLWRTGMAPTRIGQARVVHTSGAEDTETFRAVRVPFNYDAAPEREPPTSW